jgi:hypothetical protein
MNKKSKLTAISRKKLSTPVDWLLKRDLIVGPVLDYGCGRGDDVRHLQSLGFDATGYDPHWGPHTFPWREYPTILCTYVFNVLSETERNNELSFLRWLMQAPWGKDLFITVRRDLKEDYKLTSKGTEQWLVRLDHPVLVENNNFCIYHLTNTS